jgi:pyruvate dehydrogenase E2 component (dihydrolipoamide acetyltransferase)
MTTDILLPVLGESISEAVLMRWLKQPGNTVRRGEEIAEIETAKATLMLECPQDGVLAAVFVEPGATVAIGERLAVVARPGETLEMTGPPAKKSGAAKPPPKPKSKPETIPPIPDEGKRISPGARRRAEELGINVLLVEPAEPGARVTSQDVERYAIAASGGRTEPAGQQDEPLFHFAELSAIRKETARRMAESAREIPQFSVMVMADAEAITSTLFTIRERLGSGGPKMSITALLMYLLARALKAYPILNASFEQGRIKVFDTINLAVAVETTEGLTAPVIQQVEKLGLADIARCLEDSTSRARALRLSLEDVQGATFTLTNLGMYGVTQFTPLVNPPQAAILGVGAIHPVSISAPGGKANLAQVISLTVAADHRVADGADVAQFLGSLKTEIENCAIEKLDL